MFNMVKKGELSTIKNWPTRMININEIKLDGSNPNVMTSDQEEQLGLSLESFGNLQDVVVDEKTMLLVDGEHRYKEYLKRGIKSIPAKMIDAGTDAQRRAIRQATNKIRGVHDPLLDAEEFAKIIDGGQKDLLNMVTGLSLSEVEKHIRKNTVVEKREFVYEDYQTQCRMCKGTGMITKKRKKN